VVKKLTKEEMKMNELTFFLIVFILCIVGTGVGIILLINGEELGLYLLFFAIVLGSISTIIKLNTVLPVIMNIG